MYNILEKKRHNLELTKEEIEYVVENYTNDNIPDYQMSALLMAIAINNMSDNEINWLTLAMAKSGKYLNLSNIDGVIVDKHSTGGIGDKTTLIVGPILAALNCKVAKMSGRSLGYTGGTIDKLESIKGLSTSLTEEEFIRQVNNINIAVISQTTDISPADKKIYALRDVTATIDSIPLIASSIMSKKIASGSPNLVLDVKVGSGAFMKDLSEARLLATKMVSIGKSNNINTVALITNMDIPLGLNVGNILEIQEAIEILKGKGPSDLKELCYVLASYMYSVSFNVSFDESYKKVVKVIENGKAYLKFKDFIEYQGGSIDCVFNTPKHKYEVYSNEGGYITSMNSEGIGKVSCMLGAGKLKKDDVIDCQAGIILSKKTGDYVLKGDLLATFYSNYEKPFAVYEKEYINNITFSEEKPILKELILDIIK